VPRRPKKFSNVRAIVILCSKSSSELFLVEFLPAAAAGSAAGQQQQQVIFLRKSFCLLDSPLQITIAITFRKKLPAAAAASAAALF